MNLRWPLFLVLLGLLVNFSAFAAPQFHPGEVWLDSSANPIQAHGGGVLLHSNVYYWYGEDRTPGGSGAVSCYSSTNLYDWKREGVALAKSDLPRVDGDRCFVERPKVIYNARTKKFVMWMHLEQNGYRYSRAGIAVSDTPMGKFAFLQAIRPVANTNAFTAGDDAGQDLYGGTFRDMNLFLDDDGKAYVFYSSEGNWTLYVVRLNEDFTGPETPVVENKTWSRVLVRKMREGAAPFKCNGRYYLITSACTGWKPNAADFAIAESVLGPYESKGNPCVGADAETTYDTQSTFVLPVPQHPNGFIFIADEWHPQNLPDSRLVWLPFTVKTNGTFTLPWRDRWDLSIFDAKPAQ
ncbi:MAG TPA: glycoside hydrolase family 43 protein [Verrucomicrobiae bacterium]